MVPTCGQQHRLISAEETSQRRCTYILQQEPAAVQQEILKSSGTLRSLVFVCVSESTTACPRTSMRWRPALQPQYVWYVDLHPTLALSPTSMLVVVNSASDIEDASPTSFAVLRQPSMAAKPTSAKLPGPLRRPPLAYILRALVNQSAPGRLAGFSADQTTISRFSCCCQGGGMDTERTPGNPTSMTR